MAACSLVPQPTTLTRAGPPARRIASVTRTTGACKPDRRGSSAPARARPRSSPAWPRAAPRSTARDLRHSSLLTFASRRIGPPDVGSVGSHARAGVGSVPLGPQPGGTQLMFLHRGARRPATIAVALLAAVSLLVVRLGGSRDGSHHASPGRGRRDSSHWSSGLQQPVFVTNAGDARLFVVQRTGQDRDRQERLRNVEDRRDVPGHLGKRRYRRWRAGSARPGLLAQVRHVRPVLRLLREPRRQRGHRRVSPRLGSRERIRPRSACS